MRIKRFLIYSLCFIYLHNLFGTPNFYDKKESELLIEEIISSMSDQDKIGQVLMLGYMGDLPSNEIMDWIVKKKIGGIKIFGWNANDLDNLTATISVMQKAAIDNKFSIPLLVATDQEGGWVRHVRGATSETAGNMALGAGNILFDAWKTGYFLGLELKTLGINMNFAPVVDIYLNPKADVIGPRAFSSDPISTAMLGLSFYKGMDSTRVISTAKHFPGHGDTDKDSHGILPQLEVTLSELNNIDLIPYKILIKEKIPSIMVGHLAFPQITKEVEPASLSHFFNTQLLRGDLNYKGLIISDDLFMHGARSNGLSLPEVCEKGLRSGLDLLLVSRNPMEHRKIWNHLIETMEEDDHFKSLVNESVRQVLRAKIEYLKNDDSVTLFPQSETIEDSIPAKGASEFFLQQALRSVSLLKKGEIPLSEEKTYLLSSSFADFFYEGRKRFPKSDFHRYSYSPDSDEISETVSYLIKEAKYYDHIVFNLHNNRSLRILKGLESIKEKLIVFSVLTPVYFAEVTWVETALAVYGTGEDSIKAGFSVLYGDYIPDGLVPVSIKGIND